MHQGVVTTLSAVLTPVTRIKIWLARFRDLDRLIVQEWVSWSFDFTKLLAWIKAEVAVDILINGGDRPLFVVYGYVQDQNRRSWMSVQWVYSWPPLDACVNCGSVCTSSFPPFLEGKGLVVRLSFYLADIALIHKKLKPVDLMFSVR